ncbi:MAG: transposase [Candidatus Hadarchaeaceae archaeon]
MLSELGIRVIDECLAMIAALDWHIRVIYCELDKGADESEDAKLLMTSLGIWYFSALAILAEKGDVLRFSDAETLCSYAGLVPSVHHSGAMRR